jgi:hypothetical protein
MSRQLVPPNFSLPPEEYDPQYFSEMVRSLSQLVNQLQNPGELRGTKITLTDLPMIMGQLKLRHDRHKKDNKVN